MKVNRWVQLAKVVLTSSITISLTNNACGT